jgi:hypothetical protein
MADEVEGTVAPQTFPIPQFIKDAESPIGAKQFLHLMPGFKKGDPAPASYEKVEIFNFSFLGREFEPGVYNQYDRNPTEEGKQVVGPPLTVTGVTAEFRAFLIAAQRDIFQGYATRQASRGEPVTKDGFTDYCGVIGKHKAFQPRDGKHKRGAAIDIDPTFNPYTVTGKDAKSPPFSGEMPGNFRKDKGGDTPANRATLTALRQAAMDAYENALQFVFGSKAMDMQFRDLNGKRDPSDFTFERYDRVSRAMRVYMTCGFAPTKTNRIPKNANAQTRSLQDIRDTILNFAEADHFEGGDAPFKATDNAFLQAFQSQVATDFAAMRKVCIYDSWTLDKGVQTFAQSRDPCYGFMTLRRHVVKGLLDVQIKNRRLRWGALHFGSDQSGDIMHFDIGSLADSLQSTTEPNPNGIFLAP